MRILISIFLFLNFCASEIQICDHYNHKNQICEIQSSEILLSEKFSDFDEIIHQLYFKEKITLGIIYKKSLFENLSKYDVECKYHIFNKNKKFYAEGKLKGVRIYDDSIWCFDYLAIMIQNLFEHPFNQKELEIKKIRELFPVFIETEINLNRKHQSVRKKKILREFKLKN